MNNMHFLRKPTIKPGVKRDLLVGVMAMLSFGCAATTTSSSNLANMWRDPAFNLQPMHDILVIAIKKDATKRRLLEDGLIVELNRYGVIATPSYRAFPNAIPDTAQVIEAVRRDGYDGVLIARKLDTETQSNYVPGYTSTEPITSYNQWTNSYSTYYRQVRRPGYTDSTKVARHEVNVWTTKEGGRLVWSGTSEILDPSSAQAVREEFTKLIVPELARQKIIPSRRK